MSATQQMTRLGIDEELGELVREASPAASVYLGERHDDTDDAGAEWEIRARAAIRELERQGADAATLEAVRRGLASEGPQPLAGYALVAAAGRVLLGNRLTPATFVDEARFGAPVALAPLLQWKTMHPSYVTVLTDRTGADVTSVAAGNGDTRVTTVIGPDDEIERNAPGGWSQPRFQRRAEDSWRHNAAAVAAAAIEAQQRVGARLILVAGDVRAVQLFGQHFPENGRTVQVRRLPGGRSPDGSETNRAQAIASIVETFLEEEVRALVDLMNDGLGPGGDAVTGVVGTLDALATGRVRTLLIGVDPKDARLAWYGQRTLCAAQPTPGEDGLPGRLIDIAVRAALITGAEVRAAPAGQLDGLADRIGAICRYAA
jgi:hypothetical protein